VQGIKFEATQIEIDKFLYYQIFDDAVFISGQLQQRGKNHPIDVAERVPALVKALL
jgi:hypothetical protein